MCRFICPRSEFGVVDEIEALDEDHRRMEESAEDANERVLSNDLHHEFNGKLDSMEYVWNYLKEATSYMKCLRDLSPADYSYLFDEPEMTLRGDFFCFCTTILFQKYRKKINMYFFQNVTAGIWNYSGIGETFSRHV